jgi:hypothetical protein
MAQFPIALAIEPRLLSYAVENGFCMDTKAGFTPLSEERSVKFALQFYCSIVILCSAKCLKNRYQRTRLWLQTSLITFESCAGLTLRECVTL